MTHSNEMVWQKVNSSQIAEVGYNPANRTLGIRFPAGKRSPASEYHYTGVSPEVHHELVTADSVGSYFGRYIKSRADLYPYAKQEVKDAGV